MRGTSGAPLRLAAAAAIVASIVGGAAPASAAEDVGGYADWTMDGSGNAYTGTMTLPGNFPAASFTSDARAVSQLNSGNSTWLPDDTPFGEVFGDSRGQRYPNLRPYADRPGAPSTTTFSFDSPTPAKDWGFTLGDIDADTVEVSATDADGNPVPVTDLGFQGGFNYCDASPRSNACSGTTEYQVPTWVPGGTSGQLVGDGVDKVGSSGWFRPTVAIKTLTFSFTRLSGFPVYQTWFARLPKPVDPPDEPDEPGDGNQDGDGDGDGGSGDGGPGGDGVANGPDSGDRPSLPITGGNPLTGAAAGLTLIAVGAGALWAARCRVPKAAATE